jgi:uncharacterized membrane protein (DUF106 family)
MPPYIQPFLDSGNIILIIAGIIALLLLLIPKMIADIRATQNLREMVQKLITSEDPKQRADLLKGISLLQARQTRWSLTQRTTGRPNNDPGG